MTTITDVPPRADRVAFGRAARRHAPRSCHATWAPPPGRPDPISVLVRQARTRLPDLVPIRHARMAESPFAFFRGSAAIMAWDLAQQPRSGLLVQACGDAHLANFGVFAAPDRQLVFDLNDFDETYPAPFEWDVKRLAASVFVSARQNGHSRREARTAVRGAAAAYRLRQLEAAEMRWLDIWYTRLDADPVLKTLRGESGKRLKVRKHDQLDSLERFAEVVDGEIRIKDAPPLIQHVADARGSEWQRLIADGLRAYRESLAIERRLLVTRYRFVDFALKVVGVGSVGKAAFMVLLMGDRHDDPLFLQVKEAQPSVLEPHVAATPVASQGQRVVHGQQLVQAAADPFLGWIPRGKDQRREFYVRRLQDKKASVEVEGMTPPRLARYAELCATALARAHARTGDPVAIAAYLGASDRFERAIESFAEAYAEQTAHDHALLVEAIQTRRLSAAASSTS